MVNNNEVVASFMDGSYAKWIKAFQRKNPETISFSNNLSVLNKSEIHLVSLNPIKIEAKDISPEDFENLGLLPKYFDYVRGITHRSKERCIVISVEGILYELCDDSTLTERIINVIDINDDTDITPVLTIN